MKALGLKAIPVVLAALAVGALTLWLNAHPALNLEERIERTGRRPPQVFNVQFPGNFEETGATAEALPGSTESSSIPKCLANRSRSSVALTSFIVSPQFPALW